MDNTYEQTVVRENASAYNLLYGVITVSMVIFGLVGILGLASIFRLEINALSIGALVIGAGMAVLAYFSRGYCRMELDYSFVNGHFEAARVLDNKKRQEMVSLDLKGSDEMGVVNDPQYQKLSALPELKKIAAYVNSKKELYFLHTIIEGKKTMIIFEPDAELVRYIRLSLRQNG